MELARLQPLLARLYTDDTFREQMICAPEKFAQSEGWSSQDLEDFLQISQKQIQFFADTLKQKRLQEVEKILFWVFKTRPQVSRQQFLLFAKTFVPQGLKKHQEDAYQFLQFLLQPNHQIVIEDPFWKEMIRYEFCWLKIRIKKWKKPFYSMAYFQYPIQRIALSLLSQNTPVMLAPQATFAVWFRVCSSGRLYHYQWSLPFQKKEKYPSYE